YDPLAAMTNVVTNLLESLRRNSRKLELGALLKLLEHMITENVEQKLSYDCEGIIAVRQLDELNISVVDGFAEIRERVFRAPFAFRLSGKLQQQGRLADQIPRDVRERNILFENRTVTAPL